MPNAKHKSTDLPSFTLLSNGTEISAVFVIGIRVSTEIAKIPEATIILADGNLAKQTFETSSKADFIPGKEIEIKAGYYQQNETIFKGIITKHSIRTSPHQNSTLTIELKHALYKTTLNRKSAVFMKQKDSDILEKILGDHGISKSVEATTLEHPQMLQMNCNDWDFLNLRAEANALLVLPKIKEVALKKANTSNPEKFELKYGTDIVEADLEIDSRLQFPDFEGQAWNPTEQALETGSPNVSGLGEVGNLSANSLAEKHKNFGFSNGGNLPETELQGVLNQQKTKSILGKVRGTVQCEGTSEVEIGDLIKLSGLGERFNGKAFVSGVFHEISAGRWFTTFQIGLSPERYIDRYNDISEKPASGLLSAVNGLQIGVVSKIVAEDDSETILVKIPIASETEEAVWARVARLDAGNKRGTVFHPEEGDEVIIGFINDDPRQAVILGMLHSAKHPVPEDLKAADKNPIKGIVTRSELKILFDDEKKIITIQTEKGKILIDDDQKSISITDDNNKNSIVLDDKGITINTDGELSIAAKKNVTIEGKNVNIKAKSSFGAEGASGASLKSNGVTEIKGSMVNIN